MIKIYYLLMILAGVMTVKADDLTAVVTNADEGLNNGEIILTVSGGAGPFIFLWSGPDGFSSDEKDINALSPGEYCVTVTDAYCGTAELCIVVEEEADVSAEEIEKINMLVWPNPAGPELNISFNVQAPADYSITLTDESGREIYRLENYFSAGATCVQMIISDELAAGNYICSLSQGQSMVSKKILHIH